MKTLFLSVAALAAAGLSAEAQLGREKTPPPDLAAAAYDRGDFGEALELSKAACSDTATSGCALYGDLLRRGLGVPQDYRGALKAYDRGCEGGVAEACAAKGNLLTRGVYDVDADPEAAEAAYERACDLGSTNGCAGYGLALFTSQRGDAVRAEGLRLLRQTCREGFEYSCRTLQDAGQRR